MKQLALMHADPGIVQLYDVELGADPPYYVRTYAPGASLATRLDGGQRFAPAEALKVFRRCLEVDPERRFRGARRLGTP